MNVWAVGNYATRQFRHPSGATVCYTKYCNKMDVYSDCECNNLVICEKSPEQVSPCLKLLVPLL